MNRPRPCSASGSGCWRTSRRSSASQIWIRTRCWSALSHTAQWARIVSIGKIYLRGVLDPGLMALRRLVIGEVSLYAGDADAPLLRATHLTAGLSVAVVLLLGGTHRPSGWWLLIWWVAVVLLSGSGAAALPLRHPRSRPTPAAPPVPRAREGNGGTTQSPARPAHTPSTGSSGKPLPGLPPTLRPRGCGWRPSSCCLPAWPPSRPSGRAGPGPGKARPRSGARRASLTQPPASRRCPRRESGTPLPRRAAMGKARCCAASALPLDLETKRCSIWMALRLSALRREPCPNRTICARCSRRPRLHIGLARTGAPYRQDLPALASGSPACECS
jgi:hypothetical protein